MTDDFDTAAIQLVELEEGLKYTDVKAGKGPKAARGHNLTVKYTGLAPDAKGGWREFDSNGGKALPFKLGSGDVIRGWEAGLVGMRQGGTRRLVVPSSLGYRSRAEEPRPRSFGQQQRLYGTVLNQNRITQEAQGLGEGQDVAGVVAIDIQVINVRPPLP